MDISNTTVPDSTQVNAEDLLSGPRIVTISDVRLGTDEQPVNIDLVEFPGRAYRPSKTMRRVLVAAWGPEAATYVGRRIKLYRDPEVTFGRDKVGGIKIEALSHIEKRLTIALTVTRGKRSPFVVEPLPDVAPAIPEPTVEQVAASTDQNELRDMWQRSGPERRAQIQARVAELTDSTEA
jgi:hypothetical protein